MLQTGMCTCSMSQHVAPAMLRYVVPKWCDGLAGACKSNAGPTILRYVVSQLICCNRLGRALRLCRFNVFQPHESGNRLRIVYAPSLTPGAPSREDAMFSGKSLNLPIGSYDITIPSR